MFPLARRCARLVRLLTVLWAVGRCEASQSHSQPSVNVDISPDQLLRLILQEVRESEIQPLNSRLISQINGLDSRLIGIESRLNALDFKQDRFDSRLDELVSRADSMEDRLGFRLDELVSRADSTEDRFDSRLDELVSRVDSTEARFDSRLDEVVSRVDSTEDRFGSRLDELVSRADSTEARVDSILDELVSRADSMEDRLGSRLDELVSRADSTEDRFDSRLDKLVSRVNSTEDRFDYRLVSRVNSTEDRLDYRLSVPRDCSELPAGAKTGVHLLLPGLNRSQPPVSAYCDLDTDGGGWTVIQRRADIQPRQDFYLGWVAYKEGFGELNAEFWWGLDNMWTLTASQNRRYELRVNLADFDGGRRHATYQQFRVASEADGYRLVVANYTGDAGDSLDKQSGQKFTTRDKDQDGRSGSNCARSFKGAWWHKNCYDSNLNGQYLSGPQAGYGGVIWKHWKGLKYSLKNVEMKIRPVNTV